MDITSSQNPRVKYIVRLRDDKRQRQKDGLMLVEGFDEVQLALAAGYKPQSVLTAPELVARQIDEVSAESITVNRPVFEKMSYRQNPDGWLAVFPIPRISLDNLKLRPSPLMIVAESIEKPGNLGAILRTADAAKVDALLVCDPQVDAYSPNVVRASRGAIFTVPVIETSSAQAAVFLQRNGIRILAATPSAKDEFTRQDLRGPLAVAVGTEDEGLSEFWLSQADIAVKIPMLGKVNSLNVSVSTALIIYEAIRQRG
ncbi:MAG TPA: RNA methyltransferase [Anaerolineales bacterium]|nr:RNA methyltransferase [Anaerolineales bacterium]